MGQRGLKPLLVLQAADSNGSVQDASPSNADRGGPASSSSDTVGPLDLDTDSPYISVRSSRQNSLQESGPSNADAELEASVLDTLTDSVLTGVQRSQSSLRSSHARHD